MKTIISTYMDYFLVFISSGILFLPIIMYLFTGWVAKRREILSAFSEDAIKEYFGVLKGILHVCCEDNQKILIC